MTCKHTTANGTLKSTKKKGKDKHGEEKEYLVWQCSYCGKKIPDQYVMKRNSKYLHLDDQCIRPGGCSGKLFPISSVLESYRKDHEEWLVCDICHARYSPVKGHGFVWHDQGYYGYAITYED